MAKSGNTISFYNLFFLFFCIIWTPLQLFYLHVDSAGRTTTALVILAIVLNYGRSANKQVTRSPAFVCWTILVLYSVINSLIKGWESEFGFWIFAKRNFVMPYVFLWITIIELSRNKSRCLNVVLVATLLYMLMGAAQITLLLFERGLSEGLGNALPLTAISAVFVASMLYTDKQLKGGLITLVAIVVFAISIIVICATRKAFGAVFIILVGLVLGLVRHLNAKSIMTIVVSMTVFVVGLFWVMNNTMLGARFSEGDVYDVPLSSNPKVNSVLMLVLGDRAIQYYEGLMVFHEYPLTGIGILNYAPLTHTPYRLHTEYMVQLVENGLIGFSLLMIFYIMLLFGLKKRKRQGENVWLYFFGLMAVLFINLTGWTFDASFIILIYAIIIDDIYPTQPLVLQQNQ